MVRASMFAVITAALVSAVPVLARAEPVVRDYWIDAHGRVAGLMLDDGTELVGTSAQGDRILASFQRGDPVELTARGGAPVRVRNARSGRVLELAPSGSDAPASAAARARSSGTARPRMDDVRDAARVEVTGRVAAVTHTPQGEPAGVLMDSGTQVHVLPRVAAVLRGLRPGDPLRVEGRGVYGAYGLGVWATTIVGPNQRRVLDLGRGVAAPELSLAPAQQPAGAQ